MKSLAAFFVLCLFSGMGGTLGMLVPLPVSVWTRGAFGGLAGFMVALTCIVSVRWGRGELPPGEDGDDDPEPGPLSPDDFRKQVLRAAEDGSIDDVLASWRGNAPPSRRQKVREALREAEGAAPPVPRQRFRLNQAVRQVDGGPIYGVLEIYDSMLGLYGETTHPGGKLIVRAEFFAPACPVAGEIWQWYACSKHLPKTTGPQKCPPLDDWTRRPKEEREAAECGCLQPVNFGKGTSTVKIVEGESYDLTPDWEGKPSCNWLFENPPGESVEEIRAKLARAVKEELTFVGDSLPSWKCNWTLGIHTDGPCQCEPGMTRFCAKDGGKQA